MTRNQFNSDSYVDSDLIKRTRGVYLVFIKQMFFEGFFEAIEIIDGAQTRWQLIPE